MKRVLTRSVVPFILLIVAAAVVLRTAGGVDDLDSLPPLERPSFVALAVAALICTTIVYAMLWRLLTCAIDPARPPVLDSMAVFACSWLGRYVPTSAPYVAGAVVLGSRIGHARASLAAALVYHNVIIACSAAALSATLLVSVHTDRSPDALWIAVAIAAMGVLAMLPSPLMRSLLRAGARRVPRLTSLDACHLDTRATAIATAHALLGAGLNGATFVLVLAAFTDLSAGEAIAAAAAFNLAGAAGIVAVPVPSGFGVREAVLIMLLHTFVPVEVATAAAIVARVMTIPVDVILGVAGMGWLASRHRRRTPIEVPEPGLAA